MKWILTFAMTLVLPATAYSIDHFELPWTNGPQIGATFRSMDLPNSVFVIEAYFLNCPYCRRNAPKFNAVASEYAGTNRVHFLDVGSDCRDSYYETWRQTTNPNHPVLNDCSRKVLNQLGTRGFPTTYVLDCNLEVVYQHTGEMNDAIANQIRSAINSRLGQVCMLVKDQK